MKALIPAALLALAACSQAPDTAAEDEPAASPQAAASAAPTPAPAEAEPAFPPLTAAGFGPHTVGQPIALVGPAPPVEHTRISEDCRIYSDPNLPDVWIMTDGRGVVQRVSVGESSQLRTAKGIGVGATEAEVLRAYPGIRKEPHEYVAAPAGNFYTAPRGQPGLRFDTDAQRRVTEISGGAQPFLSYAEGCA